MRRGGSLVPSWSGRLGSRTRRPRVNAAAALSSSGVGPHPTPLFTSSTLSSCRHLSASSRLRQDWKIDEEVDDYKDVYASDEDIERKYQKAPIEVFGKPGEIASTWYSTALVMNALEAVESDLKWLLKSKDSIPSFAQFLEIKTLPKDQMKKILQGALKGAGFHRLTQKLLVQNLIDEGELHLAPEIAAKFLDIMRAHRKEVDVTLTFASLPDKVFMENVMARIQKYKLRDGQQPVWKFKIDPELLGGYRASAPHLFTYDFTVKAQNDQMKEWLKNFEEHVARDAPAPPAVRY